MAVVGPFGLNPRRKTALVYFGFIFFKLPNFVSPALSRKKYSIDKTLAVTVLPKAILNKSMGRDGSKADSWYSLVLSLLLTLE